MERFHVNGDVVHWIQKDIYNSRKIEQECPMLGHAHLFGNERKKRQKTFHHRATEGKGENRFKFQNANIKYQIKNRVGPCQ